MSRKRAFGKGGKKKGGEVEQTYFRKRKKRVDKREGEKKKDPKLHLALRKKGKKKGKDPISDPIWKRKKEGTGGKRTSLNEWLREGERGKKRRPSHQISQEKGGEQTKNQNTRPLIYRGGEKKKNGPPPPF